MNYVFLADTRYDPASTSLFCSLANGECFGEAIPAGTWCWFDGKVHPKPGDVIAVAVARADGTVGLATKVIERAAGSSWLLSHDPPIEFDRARMRIQGTLVARMIPPARMRVVVPTEETPPHFLRSLLARAKPALRELVARNAAAR